MHRTSGKIHFKFHANALTSAGENLLDAPSPKAQTPLTVIWYRAKNRTVKSATS